jgi:hypothetical protein
MTMPSWSSWYSGRDAIATFLSSWPLSLRKRWQILPTGANGQLAVAGYCWDQQMSAVKAETIIVLTFQAARIEEITAFRSPEPFPRFGLPQQVTNDIEAPTALADTGQSPPELGGAAADRGRSLTSRVQAQLAAARAQSAGRSSGLDGCEAGRQLGQPRKHYRSTRSRPRLPAPGLRW